jgi:hypothetical protein
MPKLKKQQKIPQKQQKAALLRPKVGKKKDAFFKPKTLYEQRFSAKKTYTGWPINIHKIKN